MGEKRRALLIATDTYSDKTFRRLRTPRADADALAAVLTDPAIGGYEVETLHNPPAHEANLTIEDLFAAARSDELALLHISGHGIKDDYGRLHLAMTNSRHDRLNATAVNAQFVRNQMDNTRSRGVVVLLDCCFAGAFPAGSAHRTGENAGVLDQLGGRGSAVMTSSSALEYSFEPDDPDGSTVTGTAQSSVFTAALVKGLRTGAADRNGDGLVDVDELYEFIYEEVRAARKPQTPGLDSRFQGRLIVASSNAPRLPADLGRAARSTLPAVRSAAVEELAALLSSGTPSTADAARTALAELADDDSRTVSTAAKAALGGIGTAAPEEPTRSTSPPVRLRRKRLTFGRLLIGAALAAAAIALASLIVDAIGGRGTTAGEDPATKSCAYQPNEAAASGPPPPSGEVPTTGIVHATINTNIGPIPVALNRSLAPCAVASFVALAESGFYDRTGCADSGQYALRCGFDREPGYAVPVETRSEPQIRSGVLWQMPGHSTELMFSFADPVAQPVEFTALGTVSREGLVVIGNKVHENLAASNEHLADVVINDVVVQE
ncbi:Peptidyl-prolyl cis-trans isomerase (rotamase)-cyclophilin family [Saccharopolyspora kobensis]|uniref:Caspase domain-containing protein n=1 Tax=Saccharopolyspora kobensis TaxID=146035 RepID=A0A1H6E8D8_9PSEU|nr:caspase family protein [Saccharopolyspora kobensis]SEG93115.1 Peptidyl-prolyl cis-trans isomerase (rotamase)-cyclophilin family [Saccharopolyspora kobensis]SFD42836.1 Caspase domain-containing protein [Saccharopolyspora kobensis]